MYSRMHGQVLSNTSRGKSDLWNFFSEKPGLFFSFKSFKTFLHHRKTTLTLNCFTLEKMLNLTTLHSWFPASLAFFESQLRCSVVVFLMLDTMVTVGLLFNESMLFSCWMERKTQNWKAVHCTSWMNSNLCHFFSFFLFYHASFKAPCSWLSQGQRETSFKASFFRLLWVLVGEEGLLFSLMGSASTLSSLIFFSFLRNNGRGFIPVLVFMKD